MSRFMSALFPTFGKPMTQALTARGCSPLAVLRELMRVLTFAAAFESCTRQDRSMSMTHKPLISLTPTPTYILRLQPFWVGLAASQSGNWRSKRACNVWLLSKALPEEYQCPACRFVPEEGLLLPSELLAPGCSVRFADGIHAIS